VEAAVLLPAVPLGRHHDLLGRVVGDGALEEEDVGLLAGLQDSELGVDGGLAGHHPVRTRLRAAAQRLDVEPGGEALSVFGVVVAAEVEDEGRVEIVGAAGGMLRCGGVLPGEAVCL
jgi:hypothetical protein